MPYAPCPIPNPQSPMNKEMRRDFDNREELIAYLKQEFPEAVKRDETHQRNRRWTKSRRKSIRKSRSQKIRKNT